MRGLRDITALMLTALLLVGCGVEAGSGGGPDANRCRNAVAEAAGTTDLTDEVSLHPAFEACKNVTEFGAAVLESPKAAAEVGSDVEGWVRQKCQESDLLSDSALCRSVQ
jgi:D-tyrosyl-tRNA(Tyr) deacylase